MIYKSYKFRLYPTPEQEYYLAQAFGAKRFIFNHFLWVNNQRFANKEKHLNAFGCNYVITDMKKQDEYSWLRDMDSIILQNSTADLHQAYTNFFNSIKGKRKGKKVEKPKFKKKSNRQSFRTNCKLDQEQGLLKIPKLKSWIKIVNHQEILGTVKTVTISRCPSGKYFASILTEQDIVPKGLTGKEVGIDLGIKDLLITSDGHKCPNLKILAEKTNRLLKQQQKILARKTKGSNNYEQQRIKAAKKYEKITNIKHNVFHNVSNWLVTEYDAIYMEDLNVSGMIKNKKLSRAIHESSWSSLASMIEYKCNWYGKTFYKIDGWYPSSKTCSSCGHKMESMKLDIRGWDCPSCGTNHDRDINAAVNVKYKGQEDLYGLKIPTQHGNWDQNSAATKVPLVLQKLINKIERSLGVSSVNQGSEQAAGSLD